MKRYDVYVYEPRSGVLIGWHKFEATDSKAADAIVQSLDLSGRVELWEEGKIINRWEPH